MGVDREKEIMKFAGWFLHELLHRCLKECGKNVSAVQYPVFKKFLTCRVKRELEYYKQYLNKAVVLNEENMDLDEHDLDELMEDSRDVDKCLSRDILLLPIRIRFDYDKIIPLRRERARKQVALFRRLLSAGNGSNYHELVRNAFGKQEFLDLHNEILEIYAEETYTINASLTSVIDVDSEGMANRMHCSMIELGFRMNTELVKTIFT
jgi:hypothetical protein